MHYIVQENTFRESNYDNLILALERLGLPYTVVRCFPFTEKIVRMEDLPKDSYDVVDLKEFSPSEGRNFVFGAVKLARICREKAIHPGSMLNDNHDYRVYSQHWRENLLNFDSKVQEMCEPLNWREGEAKFLRPVHDTKAFTGSLFTQREWEEKVLNLLTTHRSDQIHEKMLIQVSTPKKIEKEMRWWVVGGKVVTGSIYKVGRRVFNDSIVDPQAQEFAQRMVDTFQLAEAFVIDTCLSEGEWKIVEAGCINSAGFYAADLQKLLIALENHFDPIEA